MTTPSQTNPHLNHLPNSTHTQSFTNTQNTEKTKLLQYSSIQSYSDFNTNQSHIEDEYISYTHSDPDLNEELNDDVSPTILTQQQIETKFQIQWLARFLPLSFYLVYILLTSMQELPMSSIAWILNKETKFSPTELTVYYNLCFIPWTIKPLWGFIADNIPICGYKRKPYMFFFSLLASCVFIAMPFYSTHKSIMRILGMFQAWCVVFCEVQIDGLVITFCNSLVKNQKHLYRYFPEFKLYMEKKSIPTTTTTTTTTTETSELLESSSSSSSSSTDLPTTTTTTLLDSTDSNTSSTLQSIPQQSTSTTSSSSSSTTPPKSQPPQLQQKPQFKSPIDIIIQNPHYYDILTPLEYSLMTTSLKSSIQSEAMTIRTAAALASSLLSVLFHVFLHPRHVVWIAAGLPIFIIFVIFFSLHESEMKFSLITSKRYKEIAHSVQSKPITITTDESTTTTSTSSSTSSTSTTSQSSSSESTIIPTTTICGYVWYRVKSVLTAILILWKPLLFMLILRSMPTTTDPMMSYLFGYLTLPPWLLSSYAFISICGGLIATIIYWKFFTSLSIISSFIIFTFVAIIGTFPSILLTNQWNVKFLHIPNPIAMVCIVSFLSSFLTRFSLMPQLILAASTTPSTLGLEATMFSIFTTMNNIGNILSVTGSLYLIHRLKITSDDFTGLPIMIIICAIISLIPLLALPLVSCTQRDVKRLEEIAEQEEEEQRYQRSQQQLEQINNEQLQDGDSNNHNGDVNQQDIIVLDSTNSNNPQHSTNNLQTLATY